MAIENNATAIVDTMVEAQKNLVNSAMEQTKKFANGNTLVNETIEKGSEWYNKWLENGRNMFASTTQKATETANTTQTNTSAMNDFFQNWFQSQMAMGKNMWEASQSWMKNTTNTATTGNPMEQAQAAFNNWTSQWNNMFSNMNTANNWMNSFKQFTNTNPFNMDSWKSTSGDMTNIFNQWYNMMTTGMSEWQSHLQNGTTQDAFRNMLNSTEGFTRFYQMWAPLWKSIQDKTFNTDMYKNMMSPAAYQEFMDKFFGFMPEGTRQYMQQMTTMLQNGAKSFGQQGTQGYQQFRNMMAQMPGMNSTEGFSNMLSMYQNMQSTMQNAISPITRMITPNKYTKSMADWQEIADRAVVYNIKNTQMQYMMYAQGTKVMDALAENVMHKMEAGEEVKSMMNLYQDWLAISDKQFVALFESDEYSELMAEVSALQLKLRKDMEGQMEKALVNIPVATRTELDELYKTIYDLKKEVRQLNRMMELDGEVATATETAATEEEPAAPTAKSNARGKKA
jgi:hypothetical protein